MNGPKTISDLITAFGGPTDFANALALKTPSVATEMRRNGSIRVVYWPRIVEAAAERGIPDVTFDSLAKMQFSVNESVVS